MGFKLTTLVVIDNACICSCMSNYHMITTSTALYFNRQLNNIIMEKKLICSYTFNMVILFNIEIIHVFILLKSEVFTCASTYILNAKVINTQIRIDI